MINEFVSPHALPHRLIRLSHSPTIRLLLALLYTAILSVALLQSSSRPVIGQPAPPGPPDLGREIILTLGHLVTFTGLTLMWWWALRLVQPPRRAMILTIIGVVIFGIMTELAQSYVPDRGSSIEDLMANVLAVAVGTWIIQRFLRD